jgi:hypothetical protein
MPRNIYNILKISWYDLKFIFKPQIWSKEDKVLNTGYFYGSLAAVVTAAAGPLLLILLLRKTIVLLCSLLLPLLYSIFLLLIGGSHMSKRSLDLIYNYKNTVKRWYHNFILTWDLVNAGKASPEPIGNFLRLKTKRPSDFILKKPTLFFNWMKGVYSSIPIQLLTARFIKIEKDTLPAVNTAVKVLCFNKVYNNYHREVVKLMKLERQLYLLNKKHKARIKKLKKGSSK